MKAKAIALATCTLALAGCKVQLWKSPIADANSTGTPMAVVMDKANATYQLYPVDTVLHLRKLDITGKQLWSTPVDSSLADSMGASALKTTSTGVVVGYGTGTTAAFVRAFDGNGSALWQSDLGTHTAESIADLVVGADDSVNVAIKTAGSRTNTLRLSPTGAIQWDKTMPNCALGFYCATAMALNKDGLLLQTIAEVSSTKSYLIDSAGTTLWNRSRSTGISLSGVAVNPVTPTANGFVVSHAFATWEYDLSGTQRWSVAFGSPVPVVTDASGNLFVTNGTKISKLDANGGALLDISMPGQLAINQIEWREDTKRLVALSQYSQQTSLIIGKLSLNIGASLWLFDGAGKRIGKLNGAPTVSSGDACEPFPSCSTVETVHGDLWTRFAAGKRMIVVSGMVQNGGRYASAYGVQ